MSFLKEESPEVETVRFGAVEGGGRYPGAWYLAERGTEEPIPASLSRVEAGEDTVVCVEVVTDGGVLLSRAN